MRYPSLFFGLVLVLSSCVSQQNQELSQRYYNIGNDFYKQKRYSDAVKYYSDALDKNPALNVAFVNYGLALIELRRFKEAETQLNKAQRIDPQNTIVLSALGYLSYQEGNYKQAADWLEQSVKVNPYNPDTFFNLGIALQKDHRYSESQQAFEQVKELRDPKNLPQDILHYQGANLLQLGQKEEGLKLYEEYFSTQGRSDQAYQGLYDYYVSTKNYQAGDEKLTEFQKKTGPNSLASFLQAELAYLYLKNNALGDSRLQEAVNRGFRDKEKLQALIAKLSGNSKKQASTLLEGL